MTESVYTPTVARAAYTPAAEPPATSRKASLNRAAVVGSIAYVLSFAVVIVAEFGVNGRLMAPGNPGVTAQNILAHEAQFHLGIVLDLMFCVATVVVVGAYYTVLEPFGRTIAIVSSLARLANGAMWMLATVRLAEVLRMVKGAAYLGVVGTDRLNALAQLDLAMRGSDYYLGLPFWAISATLLAYLWLKSGYIPRPFAWIGVVASAWAIFCAFAYLAVPGFAHVVNLWWFDSPMALFELGVAGWILAKRLR
jgi:hypothetical protein